MATKPLRIPNSNKKKKDENKATFSQSDLDLAKKQFLAKQQEPK